MVKHKDYGPFDCAVHKIHCGISDHGHHDLDDSQVYTDTIQVNLPKHDTCERACA